MKTDGLIFDMDGTLWDSTKAVVDSWNIVFRRLGLDYRATIPDINAQMGKPMPEIFASLLPGQSEEVLKLVEKECCAYENEYLSQHGGVLYPKLRETLEALSDHFPLFIVSNCQSGYIEAFLAYHGLGHLFRDCECWGNTLLSKAENIKLVINRNFLIAPVYVGDTALDGVSSRKAGALFVHAAYGFGSTDDCDASISSFSELIDLFCH